MNDHVKITDELAFLHQVIGDRGEQYRSAWWLKTPFSSKAWACSFGNSHIEIDFQIELEEGSFLTHPHHSELLETFKCWLCVQTHPDLTGGKMLSDIAAYHRVCRVLHLIDYFLLNASVFQLAKYGLGLVTEGDLRNLIFALAGHKQTAEAIYRWSETLTKFLRNQAKLISTDELQSIIAKYPEIANINSDQEDRTLALSDVELIHARTFLWSRGFYRNTTDRDYQHSPQTLALAELLYPNTLRGKFSRPVPLELCISPVGRYNREYPGVPVRTGIGMQRTDKGLDIYVHSLRSLGLLAEIGLPVPLRALEVSSFKDFRDSLNTKPLGRTRTPPQTLVFQGLKHAIEFTLEYGSDLLDSYQRLLRKATEQSTTILAYAKNNDITPYLTPKIRNIGVTTWHLSHDMMMYAANPDGRLNTRLPASEYFRRIRCNEGLWEMLRVLYGAIAVCLGTLMARRGGELIELVAGQCLDQSRRYLIFNNRKSGVLGIRETKALPIPHIATEMIGLLENFQERLFENGHIHGFTEIFACPTRFGNGLVLSKGVFTDAIDMFCDYFETPLNAHGQRYYIRQHQLRRFFAMLFFWGRSFGGLDTLRWFLGHTDVEHLYHYITESTPGAVLQSVKATYAADLVRQDASGNEALTDLLEKHFGTRNFSVLDGQELDDYLHDLIEDGTVDIEPEFFETGNGQSFRVLVLVKEKPNATSTAS